MNKNREENIGVLTNRMNENSDEFNELQAILLNKSRKQTEQQKRDVELMALKFNMEDYLESDDSDITSVGEYLKTLLRVTKIRQNKFADYIGLKPSNLSKLICGERPISHEVALVLGKIFKIEPMIWLNIQAKNELKRLTHSDEDKYNHYSLNELMQG
jgi:addiction module HigA family antidote